MITFHAPRTSVRSARSGLGQGRENDFRPECSLQTITAMVEIIRVPEFKLKEAVEKQKAASKLFVLFYASEDEHGVSWCPDCVKAMPLIRQTLQAKVPNSTLLEAAAGDRPTYRTMENHPYKTDPVLQLKYVPTLLEYLNGEPIPGRKLEDSDCHDQAKLNQFIQ
ncbi:hypothetical protein HDV06_001875 [Boothiomyces sp. JEL0866]|nr:hypothetical protein HDV06_001875 [Boothiomyces sp. JEL0866]